MFILILFAAEGEKSGCFLADGSIQHFSLLSVSMEFSPISFCYVVAILKITVKAFGGFELWQVSQ